ncbi:MAG: winged helix-turn-helix transcriptional regulator [Desulfobulbaceae bacterium]|nr:winged helix-turn-helix transcriptional regulator [Desulfobulbaceae bacterium]
MPRILKAYSRDAYVFSSRFVRTVFPKDQDALAMEREDHGNVAENRLGEKLGENERAVLLHLVENRKASITSLATVVGLSTTGVEKIISRLKDKGVLRRIGPAKGGHWEVIMKD